MYSRYVDTAKARKEYHAGPKTCSFRRCLPTFGSKSETVIRVTKKISYGAKKSGI